MVSCYSTLVRLAAEFMHILHHIHTLLSGNRCSSDKMSSFTAIVLKLVNHVYLGKQGPLPFGLVAPVQYTDLYLNQSHLKHGERLARGCGKKS